LEVEKPILIRRTREEDLPEMLEIYNDSVISSAATFELKTQTIETRMNWFRIHGKSYPLLIAVERGKLLGYCSISQFQKTSGYFKTVELSVYVEKHSRQRGIATRLVGEIIDKARTLGYHAIISSIANDNKPSIRLHKNFGFRRVGCLKEVGFKFSKWQDTTYYELIL